MTTSFNTAVYIGTGSKEAIKSVIAQISAKQYVFVVPGQIAGQPQQVDQIKTWTTAITEAKVTVLEQPVSADGETHSYFRYNLDMFNGYGKASGLLELFPNVQLKSTESADTQNINHVIKTLIRKELLVKYQPNFLLLDQPNSAGHPCSTWQLAAALNSENLAHLTQIELRNASKGLFTEGENSSLANPKAELSKILDAAHFVEKVPQIASNDPDFSVLAYSFEETKRSHAELGSKLEKLQQENKSLRATLTQVSDEVKANGKLLDEKDALLQKSNALNTQLEKEKIAKQDTIDAQKSEIQDLEKLKALSSKLEKENGELKYQLEEVKLSFEANRKKLIEMEAVYTETKSINEKLKSEFLTLKAQLELLRKLESEA